MAQFDIDDSPHHLLHLSPIHRHLRSPMTGNNSTSQDSSQSRPLATLTAKFTLVLVVLGGFAAMGGLWLLKDKPLQALVCTKLSMPTICDVEFRQVDLKDATNLFEDFLGDAGGSRPEDAIRYLTGPARENVNVDAWKRAWESTLANEILSVEPQSQRNTFRIVYRNFQGSSNESRTGTVKTVNTLAILSVSPSGDLKIFDLSPERRQEPDLNVMYQRIRLKSDTQGYNLPTTLAAETYLFHKDGFAIALCREESGEWIRTPLGWIPSSATSVDLENPETVVCARRLSERAAESETSGPTRAN